MVAGSGVVFGDKVMKMNSFKRLGMKLLVWLGVLAGGGLLLAGSVSGNNLIVLGYEILFCPGTDLNLDNCQVAASDGRGWDGENFVPLGGSREDGIEPVLDPVGCGAGWWIEDPNANPGLVADCEALIKLHNRVAGGRVRSELSGMFGRSSGAFGSYDEDKFWMWGNRGIERWDGVELSEEGRVVELTLWLGSGAVSVPEEIAELSELRVLDLSWNRFSEPLPGWLGELPELRELDLSSNGLSGSLPEGFGRFPKLEELSLSSNEFIEIPSEVFEIKSLKELYFVGNMLERIPAEIGNLVNLESLNLRSNFLSGSIPAEIGNLTNLERLDLSTDRYYERNNQLTGHIPPEIGNLTKLKHLDLSDNLLSGSIPPEMGRLASLEYLSLSYNELSGSIPAELGNLGNVEKLYLGSNALSGSIPPELGNLFDAVRLGLSQNELTGAIPSELGGLVSLESLSLGYNSLSGEIPAEILDVPNLSYFNVEMNDLCGAIPEKVYRINDYYISDNPRLGRSCVTGELLPIEDPLGCEVAYSPVTGECETPDTIPDGIG